MNATKFMSAICARLSEVRQFFPALSAPTLGSIHFHVMQAQLGLLARARNYLLVAPPWPAPFACNVCGKVSVSALRALAFRDYLSCQHCGSTSRVRQIVSILSGELFGRDIALPAFPERPDIVGCGLSDWEGMAGPLAKRLNYMNTFLHQDPRLDITTVPDEFAEHFDFVISGDVFEHIEPPVSRAFAGLRRLLKPDGFAVFTVPWVYMDATIEHYPDLYQYRIDHDDQEWLLRNTTRGGQEQIFRNLQFHGGEGQVLELRLFALPHLIEEARNAGMSVEVVRGHVPIRGIYRLSCHSHPLILRPVA